MTEQYVGTKIITAWPQEKDGQPGYGVKYSDGYISWSPKEIFDSSYLPMGNQEHLPAFRQRLVGEFVTLCHRTEKLGSFLGSVPQLTDTEQEMLNAQYIAMQAYADALSRRIKYYADRDPVSTQA